MTSVPSQESELSLTSPGSRQESAEACELVERARAARSLYGAHPCTDEAMDLAIASLRRRREPLHLIISQGGMQDMADTDAECWSAPRLGGDLCAAGVVAMCLRPETTIEDLCRLFDGLDACAREGSNAIAWATEIRDETSERITLTVPDAGHITIAAGARAEGEAAPRATRWLAGALTRREDVAEVSSASDLARVLERQHAGSDAAGLRGVRRQMALASRRGGHPEVTAELRQVMEAMSPAFRNALLAVPRDASAEDLDCFVELATLTPIRPLIDALQSIDAEHEAPSAASMMLFRRLSHLSELSQDDRDALASSLGIAERLLESGDEPGLRDLFRCPSEDHSATDTYGQHLRAIAAGGDDLSDQPLVTEEIHAGDGPHAARLGLAVAEDDSMPDALRARGLTSVESAVPALRTQSAFDVLLEASSIAFELSSTPGVVGEAASSLAATIEACGGLNEMLRWLSTDDADVEQADAFLSHLGPAPVLAAADQATGRAAAQVGKLARRALEALDGDAIAEAVETIREPGPVTRALLGERVRGGSSKDARLILDAMLACADVEVVKMGLEWSFPSSNRDDQVALLSRAFASTEPSLRSLGVELGTLDGHAALLDLVTGYASGDLRQKPSEFDIELVCEALGAAGSSPDVARLNEVFNALRFDPERRGDGSCALVVQAIREHGLTPRSCWLSIRWRHLPDLLAALPLPGACRSGHTQEAIADWIAQSTS
ncbi:MAG: hypothetical protein AAGK04_04265, partial [Planctomycetota bacterium]